MPTQLMTNAERVQQAMVDMTNQNIGISKKLLVEWTGLSMGQVHETMEALEEKRMVRHMAPARYELIVAHRPPRAISRTQVPGSDETKIEIGDICFDVTPEELRLFAMLFKAEETMMQRNEEMRMLVDRLARLEERNRSQTKQLHRMHATVLAARRQNDLFGPPANIQPKPQRARHENRPPVGIEKPPRQTNTGGSPPGANPTFKEPT